MEMNGDGLLVTCSLIRASYWKREPLTFTVLELLNGHNFIGLLQEKHKAVGN